MDRSLHGIFLLCLATLCFSLSDTTAKYLTGTLHPIEIAWVRYIVFTVMASGTILRGGVASIQTRCPALQIWRGLAVVGSAVLFIVALSRMPIAQATTINSASPLLVVLLSAPVLGEKVGLRGWLGVLAGFAGVLVVIRPGTGGFHPMAFVVLCSALCWSAAMLITKRMAASERGSTTVFWTAVSGLVVLSLLLPFQFTVPTWRALGLTLLVGVVASSGQWLTILAYRHAAASVLAPLSYMQLIWSTCLGFMVFHAVPDRWTLIGAIIIAGSGLYTVQRERLRLRAARVSAEHSPLLPRRTPTDAVSST